MARTPFADPDAHDETYSISRVLGTRRTLRERLVAKGFVDCVLGGESFQEMVRILRDGLPGGIPRDTIADSVRYLVGVRMTPHLLDRACWRLAGNIRRLKDATPVSPWTAQPYKEWVPAQFVAARRRRNRSGRLGHLFSLQVLAGLSCTMTLRKFMADRYCGYLASELGFKYVPPPGSSRRPRHVYRNPAEFVTLRISLLVDPALSADDRPGFFRVRVPPSLLKWNTEQLNYRDRFDQTYACPRGMPDALPCFLCPAGWRSCRVGCHRSDYVTGPCGRCGRDDAFFDPDISNAVCVDCFNQGVMDGD